MSLIHITCFPAHNIMSKVSILWALLCSFVVHVSCYLVASAVVALRSVLDAAVAAPAASSFSPPAEAAASDL